MNIYKQIINRLQLRYLTTTTSYSGYKFIHISPSGDYWIAEKIYAAKHNTSGYIRSISLQNNIKEEIIEEKFSSLTLKEIYEIYDTGELPSNIYNIDPNTNVIK